MNDYDIRIGALFEFEDYYIRVVYIDDLFVQEVVMVKKPTNEVGRFLWRRKTYNPGIGANKAIQLA